MTIPMHNGIRGHKTKQQKVHITAYISCVCIIHVCSHTNANIEYTYMQAIIVKCITEYKIQTALTV